MSYPQPDANQYAIRGYQFFPLSTVISSPGDIYESAQSGHAFAIGPQSDIANVNLAYFDDQAGPTNMQRQVISANRAFVGRIDARNDATYAPSQRPGKILFWSDDLYDPNYRPRLPTTFNPVTDSITFVPPVLEVIEYFKPIDSLGPARADKEFVFQTYDVGAGGGTFFLVIPYYGRKYAAVTFSNRSTTTPTTFGIVGLNYAITADTTNPYHQETTIQATGAVAPLASVTKLINAGTTGVFDALVFNFTTGGPAPLRILMSDIAQGV